MTDVSLKPKNPAYSWSKPKRACCVRVPLDLYESVLKLADRTGESVNRTLLSLVRRGVNELVADDFRDQGGDDNR